MSVASGLKRSLGWVLAGVFGGNDRSAKLLVYLYRYLWWEVWALLIMACGVLIGQASPLLMKYLIDGALGGRNLNMLVGICALMLILHAISSGLSLLHTWVYGRVIEWILFDIQVDLFKRIQKLPMGFFVKNRVGDLMIRLGSDAAQIQALLSGSLLAIASNAITIVGAVTFLLVLEARLFLICCLAVPCVLVVIRAFRPLLLELSKERRRREADISSFLNERLNGIELIKLSESQRTETRRYASLLGRLMRLDIRARLVSSLPGHTQSIIIDCARTAAIIVGGYWIIGGGFTLGGLVAFLGYLPRFFSPWQSLSGLYAQIVRTRPSLDRVFELFEVPLESDRCRGELRPRRLSGLVEFQDVRFAYEPDLAVLKGVDFVIEPGEIVALVGGSGEGKSTLIRLMLNLYPWYSGNILLDGHEARDLDIQWLRRQISVVPQEAVLFNGSIAENVSYGQTHQSRDAIRAALEQAQLDGLISSLPSGEHTLIGDRGANLSGGQRKRVSLARAFLRNAPILIYDEPTDSLDGCTVNELLAAVSRMKESRTTIIVSHDAAVAGMADKVVFVCGGRIGGVGKHRDLLASSGDYRRLMNLGTGDS